MIISLSRSQTLHTKLYTLSGGGTTGLAVAGFDWKISDKVNFQTAYSASNAAVASDKGGLTGGDTKIAAQFVLKPADNLTFGVGYANAYNASGSLGAGLNSDSIPTPFAVVSTSFKSNTIVGSIISDITKQFTFNAWGSWTFIDGFDGAGR
ncbi:MAG: hypothetical protein ACKPHM_09170, partial [Dolichospermum sp.]